MEGVVRETANHHRMPYFGVPKMVLLVNRAFVPPEKGGFWRKWRKWRICILTSKTRALLLEPRETTKMTKMAGVPRARAWFTKSTVSWTLNIFCKNPLISRDFYAMLTPIVWRILGACLLQIWGLGVLRSVFKTQPSFSTPGFGPLCEGTSSLLVLQTGRPPTETVNGKSGKCHFGAPENGPLGGPILWYLIRLLTRIY